MCKCIKRDSLANTFAAIGGQTWLSLTANQERVSRRKINYLQFGAKREIMDSEFTTC